MLKVKSFDQFTLVSVLEPTAKRFRLSNPLIGITYGSLQVEKPLIRYRKYYKLFRAVANLASQRHCASNSLKMALLEMIKDMSNLDFWSGEQQVGPLICTNYFEMIDSRKNIINSLFSGYQSQYKTC
uniref:Uncharacterized protein n=1 Tax=Wuchereria bancrofti TaxID=6293 RepID=A0AAF5RTI5_WUCBA